MKGPLAAAVLVLFVTALSYGTAAEALGHHHTGPAGCEDSSLHFCGEQAPHDTDHCTLCHVGGVSFAAPCIEAPFAELQIAPAVLVFSVPLPESVAFGPSSPRGPPALAS